MLANHSRADVTGEKTSECVDGEMVVTEANICGKCEKNVRWLLQKQIYRDFGCLSAEKCGKVRNNKG